MHPLPNTNDQSFIIERRWTQLDKQGSIISSLRYVHVHNLLSFGDIMYIHFFFCYLVKFFNYKTIKCINCSFHLFFKTWTFLEKLP